MTRNVKKTLTLSEYMLYKASMAKIPLSGTFELSPICNFSCRMCYVRKTAKEVREHSRSMMTLEQWVEIAKEAHDAGMLYLLLTGGEPLLWPDFWVLYEQLIRMGFLVSINTNGSLIDEAALERLKKLPREESILHYMEHQIALMKSCAMQKVYFQKWTGRSRN